MKGKRAPFIVDGMDSQGGSGAKQEEKRKRHSQGHNVSIAASYPPDRPPPPPYPHSSNPQPYSNYGPETPGLFQPGRPNYVYGIQQPLQFTPTPGIPRPGKPVHAPYPQQFAGPVQQLPAPFLQPRPPPPSQFQGNTSNRSLSSNRFGNREHIKGKKYSFDARSKAIAINKRLTNARVPQDIISTVGHELEFCDSVALATAVHKLGSLRSPVVLIEQATSSPEFFRLLMKIQDKSSSLNMRNIANILWGLAKIDHFPGDSFMEALCNQIVVQADKGVAQNTANTLWAFSVLQYKPRDDVFLVLENCVKNQAPEFMPQNISNTVLAFAKLDHEVDATVLKVLIEEALRKLHDFNAQALSNTLWGLSKMGMFDKDIFSALGKASVKCLPTFNSQNLANTLWAYGNASIRPDDADLEAFASACLKKIAEFSAQNLSNLAWSLARLGKHHKVLQVASHQAISMMDSMTPQAIANFIWAHATLAIPIETEFLHAAMIQSKTQLDSWVPQNLSNVAWALAVLKDQEGVQLEIEIFLPFIVQEVKSRLLDAEKEKLFRSQHLTNFMWALATLEYHPGSQSFSMILRSLRRRIEECIPQEISNASWSCARLQHYDESFMDTLASHVSVRIENFRGQNLANLIWSYAKLSHVHEKLLSNAALTAMENAHELSIQHLANILWSYATLNFHASGMFQAFAAELEKRVSGDIFEPISAFQLANIIWSLSVADEMSENTWNTLTNHVMVLLEDHTGTPVESYTQIFQAKLIMEARHSETKWHLNPGLLASAEIVWKETVKNVTISEFHNDVSKTLSRISEMHEVEFITDDKCFSIDIAFPKERVALEIDGPHHFAHNTQQPLGEMIARDDMLRARGWRVISLPYFIWSKTLDTDRENLLRNMLSQARQTA